MLDPYIGLALPDRPDVRLFFAAEQSTQFPRVGLIYSVDEEHGFIDLWNLIDLPVD